MKVFRTRFGKDIVAEVAFPARCPKRGERVIIFCSGMPSTPQKRSLLEFWARKGYVAILPRLRGTWESGGYFLDRPPHEDIREVIAGLAHPLTDAWSGEVHRLKPRQIAVIGASFGGAAALLVADDARVSRVVALSPVVDWRSASGEEPFPWLVRAVPRAFGDAYRLRRPNAWRKLLRKGFFNPVDRASELPGEKILIFHAQDDGVVSARSVARFARRSGSALLLAKRGGHFSTLDTAAPGRYAQIARFLRSGYTGKKRALKQGKPR